MFGTRSGGVLATLVVVVALGVLAPAAFAGTIRYTIPPSPDGSYSIQDNGNGIVKVTFNRCLTAGQQISFPFDLVANVTQQDGDATFNILKEEGLDPVVTFDPSSVFLQRGKDNTFHVNLSFYFSQANNDIDTFRIKLDPASGEGLGDGAGIMVSVPCVLNPPPQPPQSENTQPTVTPNPAVPTQGQIQVAGERAKGVAACIASPNRLRAHAHALTTLHIRVNTNGTNIEGALVRVTGPGFTRTVRTNRYGQALVRVRPTRRGTIKIRSDVCFGTSKIHVLGAQAMGGRLAPHVTG